MALTGDSYIDKLLNDLTNLQRGEIKPIHENNSLSNSGYQAPIKGTWYNSGGFDASGALRPNGRKGHLGVDMRAQSGTPIYPMAPGIVSSVGTDPLGGNVVNIQHANGVRTYYAHCSTVKVHKGDKVNTNTIIATVGQTGNAKGTVPHCHFQVWKDNQIQDPAKYFSVPKYTNITEQEKRQGSWISEEAEENAQKFNMKEHIKQKTSLNAIDSILKLAYEYYKLCNVQ